MRLIPQFNPGDATKYSGPISISSANVGDKVYPGEKLKY
jgi:hypothetical protein